MIANDRLYENFVSRKKINLFFQLRIMVWIDDGYNGYGCVFSFNLVFIGEVFKIKQLELMKIWCLVKLNLVNECNENDIIRKLLWEWIIRDGSKWNLEMCAIKYIYVDLWFI